MSATVCTRCGAKTDYPDGSACPGCGLGTLREWCTEPTLEERWGTLQYALREEDFREAIRQSEEITKALRKEYGYLL